MVVLLSWCCTCYLTLFVFFFSPYMYFCVAACDAHVFSIVPLVAHGHHPRARRHAHPAVAVGPGGDRVGGASAAVDGFGAASRGVRRVRVRGVCATRVQKEQLPRLSARQGIAYQVKKKKNRRIMLGGGCWPTSFQFFFEKN